jgi:hypothetical protein
LYAAIRHRHRFGPGSDTWTVRDQEIARLLEAPLGTIRARLHRGRRLFEREMWANAQEAGLLTTAR